MSTGRPGSALEEAQRLLVDHGPWTTEGGAYLESDNVTVVIHPVHDDAGDGAVDVVVTVRPRHGRSQPGTSIQLQGSGAPSVSVPLNRRGQAVFRRLPAGEWSARLLPGDLIARSPAQPSGQVIALHRITRRLAIAAGDEQRQIRHTWTSADGGLVTEILETDEAHLVVRISSSAPPSAPAVVRIRWAVVVSETTDRARTLVVPLASGDDGAGGDEAAMKDVDHEVVALLQPPLHPRLRRTGRRRDRLGRLAGHENLGGLVDRSPYSLSAPPALTKSQAGPDPHYPLRTTAYRARLAGSARSTA